MIEAPETIVIDTDTIACDGGGGPLGHPRVFLTVGENGQVECPYCGRKYVKKSAASQSSQPDAEG